MEGFKTIQDYFSTLDFELNISKESNPDATFDFLISINAEPLYVSIKKEVRPGSLIVLNETFEQKKKYFISR